MSKIKIDAKKCIGCGSCEAICPEVFEMKEDKAHVKKSNAAETACVKEAINSCAVEAISIS